MQAILATAVASMALFLASPVQAQQGPGKQAEKARAGEQGKTDAGQGKAKGKARGEAQEAPARAQEADAAAASPTGREARGRPDEAGRPEGKGRPDAAGQQEAGGRPEMAGQTEGAAGLDRREKEMRKHRMRLAKFDRIEALAEESDRDDLMEQVKMLREKEQTRHERALAGISERSDAGAQGAEVEVDAETDEAESDDAEEGGAE